MENWKVCTNTSMLVTTCVHQITNKQAHFHALNLFVVSLPRSVSADIRVRIDGVEEEHGVIRVDRDGKVSEM